MSLQIICKFFTTQSWNILTRGQFSGATVRQYHQRLQRRSYKKVLSAPVQYKSDISQSAWAIKLDNKSILLTTALYWGPELKAGQILPFNKQLIFTKMKMVEESQVLPSLPAAHYCTVRRNWEEKNTIFEWTFFFDGFPYYINVLFQKKWFLLHTLIS